MKPQAPCKDCTKRYPGCHGKCEEYKAFQGELSRYNEMIQKIKNNERINESYMRDSKKRMKGSKK